MKRVKRRIIPQENQLDAESMAIYTQILRTTYPDFVKALQSKKTEWDALVNKQDTVTKDSEQLLSMAISDPVQCLAQLPKKESAINTTMVSFSLKGLLEGGIILDDQQLKHVVQSVLVYRPTRRVNDTNFSTNSTGIATTVLVASLSRYLSKARVVRKIFKAFATELSVLPLYELGLILEEVCRALSGSLGMTLKEVFNILKQDPQVDRRMHHFLLGEDAKPYEAEQLSEQELQEWDDLFRVREISWRSITQARTLIKLLNALHCDAAGIYILRVIYERHRRDFFNSFRKYLSRISANKVRDEALILFCEDMSIQSQDIDPDYLKLFDLLTDDSSKVRAIDATLIHLKHFVDLELFLRHILEKDVAEKVLLGAAFLHGCDVLTESLMGIANLERGETDTPVVLN